MRRLHIVGGKNHGKTTLVVELVAELTRRGLRVGTIKHTHHRHELDVPGKDSHRHREAGAAVAGILSSTLNAVFWAPSTAPRTALTGDDRYCPFAAAFAGCDLVIVEGDTQTAAPKFEVWRAAVGSPPLATRVPGIEAIVTDDSPDAACPTIPRSDLRQLADLVVQRLRSP